MNDDLLTELKAAIIDGDDALAATKTMAALGAGLPPVEILNGGVVPGIIGAGELWKANKYFLPDVIMAAEAFKAAMGPLEPLLREAQGGNARGKIVIGVVEGDMHELGKSLVIAMLTSAGFDVTDLGINVPLATFVSTVREVKPDIVGLGAYMTTTMLQMRQIITELDRQGLRKDVRVLVGGVPTSQEFADEIGADAWGKDALDAMNKALRMVGA